MRTRVVFREGEPKPDMTREEAVTWLLGNMEEMSLSAGLLTAWAVSGLVDRLKDGSEVPVDTSLGAYLLTVTTTGHWWHRVRTYHAREA